MAQRPVVTLTTESDLLDVPQTGDTYLLAADVAVTGNITVTGTVDGRDVASDGALAATALQSETSHADVLVDGDFGTSGLMTTDGAGGYSITTNGSANWDTAYGWGNHASGGYLTSASIDTLAELNTIVADATLIDTGDSRLSDARTPTAHAHEGTAILSTGEVGGTKVLTENGAGGATWAAPAGGGAFTATDTKITPSTAITLNDATGNEVALNIAYTTNKATSGDDTGLVVNQTDTASPGTSLLADFQVGGTSEFKFEPGSLYFKNDSNQRISSTTTTISYVANTSQQFYVWASNATLTPSFTFSYGGGVSLNRSSSVQNFMRLKPVIAQSGTAGYNAILVDVTETSTGSGETNLLDLQVGGVSKASIDNGGNMLLEGQLDVNAGDNVAGNIGALTSIKSATATVSSSAAATLTASSLIPAGCFLIGLTGRITTSFGTSTGLTSFDIGDGSDIDRWGAAIAITSGTTVDITDATAATHGSYAAANNVVLTANGGNFDATGVIELLIHYISLTAPTG